MMVAPYFVRYSLQFCRRFFKMPRSSDCCDIVFCVETWFFWCGSLFICFVTKIVASHIAPGYVLYNRHVDVHFRVFEVHHRIRNRDRWLCVNRSASLHMCVAATSPRLLENTAPITLVSKTPWWRLQPWRLIHQECTYNLGQPYRSALCFF